MNALSGEQREKVVPILANPFTMATVLYAIALRQFGEEVHDWEPETVFLEIQDDFGVEMPKVNHDKLMALLTAISTNSFYRSWPGFSVISRSINGDENPLDQSDPLLPAEMAWAVVEVKLNDDTKEEFSEEVAKGCGLLLAEDGFIVPPPKLGFARMPEQYQGSDSPADTGKAETLSTQHAQVVEEYLRDQAGLLIRQIAALPWQDEATLTELVQLMKEP